MIHVRNKPVSINFSERITQIWYCNYVHMWQVCFPCFLLKTTYLLPTSMRLEQILYHEMFCYCFIIQHLILKSWVRHCYAPCNCKFLCDSSTKHLLAMQTPEVTVTSVSEYQGNCASMPKSKNRTYTPELYFSRGRDAIYKPHTETLKPCYNQPLHYRVPWP